MIRKLIPVFGFVLITFIFFWQIFFKGLLPIPSDTIVGLYYPYRDVYSKNFPNGIPFKNFLITDPVRQQYPWKNLSINSLKNFDIPSWNPYSFSGTPNIANFQSAVFYPLNFILFINPFEYSWTFLILLQPLLASIFMFFYLKNLKLDEYSSFFGGIIFAFSGFFAMWLEWGTILSTALWLPLILLSIDKITYYANHKKEFSVFPTSLKLRGASNLKFPKLIVWSLVLILATVSSFFAGHLQTFFYLSLFASIYIILRIWQSKNKFNLILLFLAIWLIIAVITIPQLVPSLKFLLLSGRNLDQLIWQKEGWFIPLQHLVQFLVPDFFGNPSTLNYWGTWNYGELTGFVGIVALTLSIYSVLFRRDKKTYLLILAILISLALTISNPISKIPFIFNLPFISTAQPTRLLFIIDFSLSILAALGLNYLIMKGKFKQVIVPIVIVGIVLALIFVSFYLSTDLYKSLENLNVARRNILFPTAIFIASSFILVLYTLVNKKFKNYLIILLIILTIFELFRFFWKFNTFSKSEYLYPENGIIKFLKQNTNDMRIATTDPRIMAPNFPIMHGLYSVEGYDPLYLGRYAEFIAAINRNEPNISPPFGFNRIIRVENFSSNLVDLLGVKYVLSLSDLNVEGFEKVHEEGQTKIYENNEVLPKAFFVSELKEAKNKQDAINILFDESFDPKKMAVVEENIERTLLETNGAEVKIVKYSDNEITIQTNNPQDGFLVIMDSYYPTWHAMINNREIKIYQTNYNFRGIFVPFGEQTIVLKNNLL